MVDKKFNVKDSLINKKSKFVEQLQIDLKNLIDLMKEFNPYDILSHLNTLLKFSLTRVKTDHYLDGSSIELKYILELVQMIISCIPKNKFKKRDIEEEDIHKIMEMCSNIYSFKIQYIMAYTFEMYDVKSDESQYIFESEINSEITGKRYDVFEVEHYIDLFTPLKDVFEKSYGFPLGMLFDGIDKLKKKYMFGINDSLNEILKIMERCNCKNIETDRDKFYSLIDEMFGLNLQNVGEITNWSTEFLDMLSYEIGENVFSTKDINFEKLYDLHKEINRRPLIKLNECYYYISMHRLLDNLDRIILKDLYKRNKNDIEVIKKKVGDTCEELVGNYIKEILPKCEVLTSNYYKSEKKICENDVLIIFDKYLFIIEVKSGSFTPDVAINNMISHFDSLKRLIEDADSQTNRFMDELEKRKSLEIYESNNKKSREKKTIKLEDYKEIFKIFCPFF